MGYKTTVENEEEKKSRTNQDNIIKLIYRA